MGGEHTNKIEEAFDELQRAISRNRSGMMEQMWLGGRGEHFILKFLSEKNSAVFPSEISGEMQASTARISAALGSLEKKGQIHREIDKNNRRNILVTITESGRARCREETGWVRRHMIGALAEMGERDAAELVRLLKLFFEAANRADKNGRPRD